MTYHSREDGYWREDACYQFTTEEVETLETATAELHQLCLKVVDRVIRENRFSDLRIPESWRDLITTSWEAEHPSLYGRFDLWYDGHSPPKLLEYNADTPTALLEAAVAQWFWFQALWPEEDQFNSLHERLIAEWKTLLRHSTNDVLHLSCLEDVEEDQQTIGYLADTAYQAGWRVGLLPLSGIGWDQSNRRFVDQMNEPIEVLFKLYPWEWLLKDTFAAHVAFSRTTFVEPVWKLLLSHKGLLPLLWEWFPDHPLLLPAWWTPPADEGAYVEKPFWSREGANVTIVRGAHREGTQGPYGEEGWVYQAYQPLPEFDGWHPVVGSWIVGQEAAGIGIREDRGPITGNCSWFVPHYFIREGVGQERSDR
jgi:glutathionylspermidine synthase